MLEFEQEAVRLVEGGQSVSVSQRRLVGPMTRSDASADRPGPQRPAIHCSPAVRYGEVPVSVDDALAAHWALLRTFAALARVGQS